MIWEYNNIVANDILKSYTYNEIYICPYCRAKLVHLSGTKFMGGYLGADLSGNYGNQGKRLQVCQKCGWWVVTEKSGYAHGSYEGSLNIKRGCGCLKNLSKIEVNKIPLKELRKYLMANYESKNLMNGRRFEEVVVAIFKDFNYSVILTEYSGDRGIDIIILEDEKGNNTGIQIKRYKNRIEAEQIRAFAGALVLNKMTRGIYITTSDYRKGAEQSAKDYGEFDIKISLINSDKVYDNLKLSQRKIYFNSNDETAGYYKYWKNIDLLPTVYNHSW